MIDRILSNVCGWSRRMGNARRMGIARRMGTASPRRMGMANPRRMGTASCARTGTTCRAHRYSPPDGHSKLCPYALFVFISVLLFCPATHADTTTGLVGWWKMDGGVTGSIANNATAGFADASGYANNGTAKNTNGTGMAWTYGTPNLGGAVSFDGVDDYVSITPNSALNALDGYANSYSISFWVKSSSPAAQPSARILEKLASAGPYPFSFNAQNTNFYGYVYDGSHQPNVSFGNIWNNNWRHIVFVVDHSATKLYGFLDGVQIGNGSSNTVTGISANSETLYFANNFGLNRPLGGQIDDVRVYNRALTASDVQELYNQGSNGLVGWWKFDEGTGTTTADSSLYGGNTGTLTGGATIPLWGSGKIGSGALSFDGTDDYVDVANESKFDFTDTTFTVTGWIKTTQTANAYIVAKNDASTNNRGWRIGINEDYPNRLMVITKQSTGSTLTEKGSTKSINDDQWHQFAAVITTVTSVSAGNDISIYIDGALSQGSLYLAAGTGFSPNNNTVKIGRKDTGNYFNGLLDDVRIYNRVLSANEIYALYMQGADSKKIRNATIRNSTVY